MPLFRTFSSHISGFTLWQGVCTVILTGKAAKLQVLYFYLFFFLRWQVRECKLSKSAMINTKCTTLKIKIHRVLTLDGARTLLYTKKKKNTQRILDQSTLSKVFLCTDQSGFALVSYIIHRASGVCIRQSGIGRWDDWVKKLLHLTRPGLRLSIT